MGLDGLPSHQVRVLWIGGQIVGASTSLSGGAAIAWRDPRRAAKRRAYAIQFTRVQPRRVHQYCGLIKITRPTLAGCEEVAVRLEL